MIPVCSKLREINVKSTSDVLAHHLKCFAARDLDGLMEDYAADAVFFTLGGMLRGREAIRGVFEKLFSEFAKPGSSIASKMRLVEGEYVYSIFTAETPDNSTSSQTTSLSFGMKASKCRLSPLRSDRSTDYWPRIFPQ